MELCDLTLKDWLERRNSACESPEDFLMELKKEENLLIFKRLSLAVEYIHDQGLIHRDLKPENIFMLENTRIKVGDFGLTTDDILSEDPLSPGRTGVVRQHSERSRHTSGVGTPSYAAPEQINGCKYTNKSDIYSLGLIFFELYQKFETQMEKSKVWGDVRRGILPPEMSQCWPHQTSIMASMISEDADKRPNVQEILANRKLFQSKDQIIADLRKKESFIMKEFKRLEKSEKKAKQLVRSKQKTIRKLSLESINYSEEISSLKVMMILKDIAKEDEIDQCNKKWQETIYEKERQHKRAIQRLHVALKKKDKELKKRGSMDKIIAGTAGMSLDV